MTIQEVRTSIPANHGSMSWGEFDKRQLLLDAKLHQLELPWLRYHACLQMHYSRWKGSKNQIGLKNAMTMEGLEYSGTQHRAIEDARTMKMN